MNSQNQKKFLILLFIIVIVLFVPLLIWNSRLKKNFNLKDFNNLNTLTMIFCIVGGMFLGAALILLL